MTCGKRITDRPRFKLTSVFNIEKTTDLKLFPTVLTTLSSQQLQHSCNGLNFISQLLKLCITKTRRKKDKNIESKRKLEPTAWVTGLARGKELDMELAKHLERKGKEKILEIFEKYSAIKITEKKVLYLVNFKLYDNKSILKIIIGLIRVSDLLNQ